MQRAFGRKDLNGWVVAALFVLFVMSVGVYTIASSRLTTETASTTSEETSGIDAPRTPLPAGPRTYR